MTSENIDLEAAVTRALEVRREPSVPEDFVARVRAALPPLPRRRRSVSFGRVSALAMAVLTAVLAFVLAAHSNGQFTNAAFDAECFFTLLAVVLTGWMARYHPAR